MFRGLSTREAYESCLKRGLCQGHLKEFDKEELSVLDINELPRKAFLYIRMNILSTILFKKSTKCVKIKALLQRTPLFSRILARGDASEVADEMLVLDSVVVFTLCELSKICCSAALFQVINEDSRDPELEQRKKLLLIDRIEGPIIHHLFPVIQENFIGFDLDLLRVSYVLAVLFVRICCVKLDIKTTLKTIEEDFKGDMQWEDFKKRGDSAFINGKYKEALQAYSSAVMLNSYSSELFAQKANVCLMLGNSKAAQLDAYISIVINSESRDGYLFLAKAYAYQKSFEEAEKIAKYDTLKRISTGDGLLSLENLKELTENCGKTHFNNKSSENLTEKSDNESSENITEKSDNKSLENITEKSDSESSKNKTEKPDNKLTENSVDNGKSSKYFPELVDSDSDDSDKETYEAIENTENFPVLVEASDSDDSDDNTEKKTVNTHIKNKSKKKRALPIPSEDSFDETTDMDKVRTCLKEASEALLSDCGYKAVQIFRGPLRTFMESPSLNTLKENEIVCIKYAYGMAYCKSGGYEDLLKGITILKEITEKHDSVTFPAANYAIGLAYRKLNRFKDALHHLETVNNFLSKGIHFKVYSWPEIITVIQETKPDVLKDLVHELIKECENPPNPDAFCRYTLCGYQPTIYYSDPDFKGYTSLLCSEQCCLQYHLQCWKTIKAEKNLTDKEFLEQNCFTPDCEGIFIKVQNIDKKGDVAKEFTSDFKKSTKQKSTKWEKKADVKEKKKKKTNAKAEDGTQESSSENGRSSSRKNSTSSDKSNIVPIPGSLHPSAEDGASSLENVQKSTQKPKSVESSALTKSRENYSVSAYSNQEVQTASAAHDSKVMSSSKEAEKVTNVSKQKTFKISQHSEKCTESSSELENAINKYASLKEVAFKLPDLPLRPIPKKFEKEDKESSLNVFLSESIKKNVYSYMSDFLQHHGPLKFDDSLLMDEVSNFPGEANTIIAEFGGIVEFLKRDMRFACVADKYICVIADIAKAYQMSIVNSSAPNMDDFPPLDNSNSLKYKQSYMDTKHPNFNLNPNAMEYRPSINKTEIARIVNASSPAIISNTNNSALNLKPGLPEFSGNSNNSQKNEPNSPETTLKMNSCPNFKPLSSVPLNSELNGDVQNTEITNYEGDKDQNFKVASKSDVNFGYNSLEKSKNLFMSAVDIPSCDKDFELNSNKMLESSKIKKVQVQLLPVLKEYCNDHYKNYHSYVNSCIKPYCLRKLPETATKGTETDFNKMEITPAEHSKQIADALKAINKQLAMENTTLKDQLKETSDQNDELKGEIYSMKLTLTRTYEDFEMIKLEHNKKEEKLVNGREYLLKCLTDSHTSIDELKKRISLLEAVNSRLEKNVEVLEATVNEVDEKKKKELEAEEKKHSETIKKFLTENSELKNRVKRAEINYLQTKKSEYLSRLEDKVVDADSKKKAVTNNLSMFPGNLNPIVDSGMKKYYAELSSYERELNSLKLDFVKKVDELIEKVENGVSLQDLNTIELKAIPDPPNFQNWLPGPDKLLPNPSQMDFKFNFGTMPQMPSAAIIPSSVSPAVGAPASKFSTSLLMPTLLPQPKPPAPVIPQTPSSASAAIVSQTIPLAAPQAIPSATVRSKLVNPVIAPPSATIVPPTAPSATVIPQAAQSTTIIPSPSPAATVISSCSALDTSLKSSFGLNSQLSDSFKNTMTSVNSFTGMPSTVPTLDPEFNKTCAIFKPPDPVSNFKPPASKVPPGIVGSKTSSVSSRTASNSSKDSLEAFPSCSSKDALDSFPPSSSKDSLETFPSAERTLSSINSAIRVTDPGSSSSHLEKKTTASKTSNSYDKLLKKLKEHFPSYTQEELISFVKEFRSQRHGKLTGLPIDTIISELKMFIQQKENQKKLQEQRIAQLQPKPNKVLVNKKLVPDPKPCPPTEQQQNLKKKSAWGIDPDNKKTFSGSTDDDCIICCDPMSKTSAYKVGCGHAFHEECIREWLKNKSNCPVCRVLLLLPEEYPSLS